MSAKRHYILYETDSEGSWGQDLWLNDEELREFNATLRSTGSPARYIPYARYENQLTNTEE